MKKGIKRVNRSNTVMGGTTWTTFHNIGKKNRKGENDREKEKYKIECSLEWIHFKVLV